jgi:Ca-activated chloride channel family protein
MTQRDKTTRGDDDLRALFDALRREEHKSVPPYRHAHWVREQPETRSILKWRLVIAGACATMVTAGLAALSVGWPLWMPAVDVEVDEPTAPPALVSRHIPPPAASPPAASTSTVARRVPVPDPTPDEPEPVRRAEARAFAVESASEAEIWIGVPEPPPLAETDPLLAKAKPLEAGEWRVEKPTGPSIPDVPVQGRFYTETMTLAPGAADGDPSNASGSPGRDLKTIVGGVANQDRLTGPARSDLGRDSMEEIVVVTAGAGAEYDVAPGGHIDVEAEAAGLERALRERVPPSGPLMAGAGAVEAPLRIPSSYVKPAYPEVARKACMKGKVVLGAVIRKDGTVGEIKVLQSGHPDVGFADEAVNAVRQWRFKPATRGGVPVEVYYTIPVEFGLEEEGRVTTPEPSFGPSIESYAAIEDNPFHVVADEPLSTFSADVDTASYSNVRRFLSHGTAPPKDAVRVEEMINYFDYDHPAPAGNDPFGVAIEVTDTPWNARTRLARVTLAARDVERSERPAANLVFLLDVSGSMRPHNKLPLVKRAMTLLTQQLEDRDTIAIVVYAGASGLALPPTPGSDRATILDSLRRLEAGGSTAGAAGLKLAYGTAWENFVPGGINRVILATDGDFNVGVTSHSELLSIIERDAKRGVFLTALGFGMGNYKDDRLEQLADRGNGNYAYIDTLAEARKVLVEEVSGTLVTVAKDVKFQVEFNPVEVGAYRLIGYENRLLAHRDFNDDTKDAGEVGAGHTVTVLYELVPPDGVGTDAEVDPLRYRRKSEPSKAARSGELFTLKIRFKRPDGDTSTLRTYPVHDEGLALAAASDDTRFAAAVAAFGMRLRQSAPVRDFGWAEIRDLAAGAIGRDAHGHRVQSLELMDRASRLAP